ncbi:hypothetical protein Poly30_47000 [Planctomycetes bacterium Poly30]|uniref:Thioredoxin n=1 Tax=Saltatorellus ferox TaxID=2528018 RepID=A0A518EYI4_9BACT|nr:hypothetical protein Poly30_47000 [Planctomycetes bacterium Poly30]
MSQVETNARYFDRFWPATSSWTEFLGGVKDKADLWSSYAGRARLHADELARLAALPGARKIMILTEDWCGDAIRSTPTIAAMAGTREDLEVRVLDVEAEPSALDSRLTRGARAVPIAIVFDGEGNELGQWGPRPAPLQAALRAKILAEGPPTPETKGEFYAPIMAWYAKDRGRTVAQEMLMILERGPSGA